jgi:GT2 family glycosyltransferase
MHPKRNFLSYIKLGSFCDDINEVNIFGHVDHLDVDGIAGWLVDKGDCSNRLTVEVVIDGQCLVSGLAQLFRPDLKDLGLSDGYSGFRFVFPPECYDNKKHKVAVREAVSGKLLMKSPMSLKFSDKPVASSLLGLLEYAGEDLMVSGWAWLLGEEEAPTLDLFLNDEKILSQKTNIRRPDLTEVGLDQKRAGFKLRIPKQHIKSVQCKIDVRVNDQLLPGSPKLLAFDTGVTARLGTVKNGQIQVELTGWPGGALTGEMFVNARSAGAVELVPSLPGVAKVQGWWPIPEPLQDARSRVYHFVVQHGETTVKSGYYTLNYPHYLLNIEAADVNGIQGWALRQDKQAALALAVFCDGRQIQVKQHNNSRSDVCANLKCNHPQPGFNLQFAAPFKKNAALLTVVDADTDIVLAEIAFTKPYSCLLGLAAFLKTAELPDAAAQRRAIVPSLFYHSTYKTRFATRILPRNTAATHEVIDVIIPVYKGYLETVECIESALASKNEHRTRYIILSDDSPDPKINHYLEGLQEKQLPHVVVMLLPQNGGFPKTVNMGFCVAEENDVILLNADTVVFDGWVDRLAAAARQPGVGTVTPFTNNGEICSLPVTCRVNPVPTAYIGGLINAAAGQLNAGHLVDLPVGVGFCMYIRRECLNEIGLFDVNKWGRGYGEEVDFCLKASAHGWRHVLCADTFVTHRGNVSFGAEKLERILASSKEINKTYPFYEAMIADYIQSDPMAPLRRRVNLQLIAAELPPCVLHVSHNLGGGTSKYVKDMIALYAESGVSSILLQCNDQSADMTFDLENTPLVEFFGPRYTEKFDLTDLDDFAESLTRLPLDRIHVHTPMYLKPEILLFIKEKFVFDVTVHDYAWICPRVTLSTLNGLYCGEPTEEKCNLCMQLYGMHQGLLSYATEADGDIAGYRRFFADFFAQADHIYAGSADVVQRLQRYGFAGRFKTIPHPRTEDSPVVWTSDNGSKQPVTVLNIAVIGAISDIKGFYVLHDCIEYASQKRLPLHFTIFGYTMDNGRLTKFKNVRILGRYEEENLCDLILDNKPVLAFQPNQWPETFSYVLNYCFDLNLWPVVTDIGAPAERVRQSEFGTVIPVAAKPESIVQTLIDVGAFVCTTKPKAPEIHYPRNLAEYTA